MKKNSYGFTLVKLMMVVAAICVAMVSGIFMMTGINDHSLNNDKIIQSATAWTKDMQINNPHIDCLNYDTDNDGYISCTIGYKLENGEVKIIPIECAAWASLNSGCRTPKMNVRNSFGR